MTGPRCSPGTARRHGDRATVSTSRRSDEGRGTRDARRRGGGVVATLAMSAALAVAAKAGQLREPPPRAIVRTLLPGLSAGGGEHRCAARAPRLRRRRGRRASLAAARARRRRIRRLRARRSGRAPTRGWVPLIRALPPAHLDDRRRQASMVAGHVVYGAVLGLLARRARRRDEAALRAPRQRRPTPPRSSWGRSRRDSCRFPAADAAEVATRTGEAPAPVAADQRTPPPRPAAP